MSQVSLRAGKLAEPVLKRAVLRPFGADPADCGKRCGADCALLEEETGRVSVYTAVCTVPGFEDEPGMLVTAAVNNLAAAGAVPEALLLHAVVPCGYGEPALRDDMQRIADTARIFDMTVIGGHTEAVETVSRPLYTVTGIGKAAREDCRAQELLRPGQELIVTKWIALAGSVAAARAHETELTARYPASLLDSVRGFAGLLSVRKEAQTALCFGKCAMHDLSQGGIFGALWEMAERAGVGLEVDLKRIPIRQETIELCEYFDLNPYCLYSAGSLLIGTDQGEALTAALAAEGIAAAVIGRVTAGRERIIRNGEDMRYLDRPQQDEWYRRFCSE